MRKLNKQQLVDAKDWLLDCCYSEEDAEFIKDSDDDTVENFIKNKFENGISGFLSTYRE